MLTQNNQVRVLVLYWYQARGKTIASETDKRVSQIRGALLERRTDGAIVRLAMPVIDADRIDQTKRALAAFAADLYPELQRILPQ
jgi:EpsI family protein